MTIFDSEPEKTLCDIGTIANMGDTQVANIVHEILVRNLCVT